MSDCPLPDTERTVPATSSLCYHNKSMMLGRSYILFPPLLYNIDTLDDKDLPLCVPNGLETAIHWIQWRHCSCKKWRTHLVKATRDILDVVFVQKLFCSVYYCLSVHIFFEVAKKNYLIWDFFQRSIWLQRHAIEKPFGFATLRVVSWLERDGGGQWV